MNEVGTVNGIVKHRKLIVIIAILLLIPAYLGLVKSKVNYDMFEYMPDDMGTAKGQNILVDDFNSGAYSIVVLKGMNMDEMAKLSEEVQKVDHVTAAANCGALKDAHIPMQILPDALYNQLFHGDETLMMVMFDTATTSDDTVKAINEVRKITDKRCFVSGSTALVSDLTDMGKEAAPKAIAAAFILALILMLVFMDSFITPFILAINMLAAVMYNLGTNNMFGEVCFVTKILAILLQFGITMTYSLYLWYSYSEQKNYGQDSESSMTIAMKESAPAIIGSSLVMIAGFASLCFLSMTLGKDVAMVMIKAVIIGVINVMIILPAVLVLFDGASEKGRHKPLIGTHENLAARIAKRPAVTIIIFMIIMVPCIFGYAGTSKACYDFDPEPMMKSAPDTGIPSVEAMDKLQEDFGIGTMHIVLADSHLTHPQGKEILDDFEKLDGVKGAIGFDKFVGGLIPRAFIPSELTAPLMNDKYQMMMVISEYTPGTPKCNEQVAQMRKIADRYDKGAMFVGEGPAAKDLMDYSHHDFKVMKIFAIIAMLVITAVLFRSVMLPLILMLVTWFSIFVTMGIPYFAGAKVPFVVPSLMAVIMMSVSAAWGIRMITRYISERSAGAGKEEAVASAMRFTLPAVIVSVLVFAATTVVTLPAAILSMLSIIFLLPALLIVFDGIIVKTTAGINSYSNGEVEG